MVVNFSIVPLDKGVSLSPYVAHVLRLVEASGLDYHMNSMGTEVEGDWEEVFALIKQCHHAMASQSARVITSIQIDDRHGATHRLEGKKLSVEKVIGHSLR